MEEKEATAKLPPDASITQTNICLSYVELRTNYFNFMTDKTIPYCFSIE